MRDMKDNECPLCNFSNSGEKIYYQDDKIVIVETKNRKGHQCRIMVVSKDHVSNVSDSLWNYALYKLIETGKKVFDYSPKFVIMEATFANIKTHWHLVATDLDPNADDFSQILKTPWIDVIGTDLEGMM